MLYGVLYTFILYLLILCLGLLKEIKHFNTTSTIVYVFICAGFINEVLQTLSAKIFQSNILLYNFATIVEFSILLFLYHTILKSKLTKVLFLVLFVLFLLLYVLELIFNTGNTLYSSAYLVRNLTIVFISIFAFHLLVKEIGYENITDNSLFWINSGVFLYYGSTLIIFGLKNLMNHYQKLNFPLMYIHFALNFSVCCRIRKFFRTITCAS